MTVSIAQIQPLVVEKTDDKCELHTDEAKAYNRVKTTTRTHLYVCHSQGEFARDEDGDGFCEVHCNTCEGLWTGVRNFLRQFRGVNKKYLAQYVAIFENAFNLKNDFINQMRALITPNFFLENCITP